MKKKTFLFVVAALFCTMTYAQTLNEGFEGEGFPPEEWEVNSTNANYGWKKGVKSGQNCALVPQCYGYESYLITPQLKPAAGESLTFSARIGENVSTGELRVEVSLNGTDASSFTVLETYYCSASKGDDAHRIWTQDWRTFTIDLSAYKNQRIYIAFHQTGEIGNGGLALDNVSGVTIAGDASCENPTNVSLGEVTDRSATITWQGTAAQYQYLLVAKGGAQDWTTAELTTQKTVTFTDLDEETAFDFYVRSYCSEESQSLAPKISFQTTCSLQRVPWLETFSRDATGSDITVAIPECWTVSSAHPQISVVADKSYSDEGESIIVGQAHLQMMGGGPNSPQTIAMPAFDARLDTLEVAFDYKTSMNTEYCGVLEVGYMTNPSKEATFVSLQTLPRTMTYQHAVVPLNDLPANAKFIAFRFAGGTGEYASLSMDNFIVAAIGHSQDIDPADEDLPDAAIYGLSYCVAQFTWYSYNAENFGIGLFETATQKRVAGIVVTNSECDRFAYEDSVQFSQYDDYENKYYCSTKWILNADALSKGEAWSSHVINIGTSASPILGLKPGNYQVQVYSYTQGASSLGDLIATIPFELVSKEVTNLQASVSSDKTKATLTWTEPSLDTDERLYVSVRSGETVVYDNYNDARQIATSPLEVNVEEGKTYTATIQVIDKKKNPLGHEVAVDFTVGVNPYEPQNLNVALENGDVATFTWTATTQADAYQIVLYHEGEFYTTLTVIGATTKTTYMPEDGNWTWTVQAFNKGTNNNYFPASSEIAGNGFSVTIPDIPSGAIEANPWEMQAAYYPTETSDPDYREGKFIWFINLLCGNNGSAYPMVSAIVYSDKNYGISGTYSTALNNIYYGEDLTFMSVTSSGNIQRKTAASLEMTLSFEGYDQEHYDEGYRFGRYSGKYTLRTTEGEVYAGRFQDIFCNSFNAEYLLDETGTVQQQHVGMWDEDPNMQAIENIAVPTEKAEKVLHGGQLYIIRPNGAIYNATGVRVK